MTDTAFGSQPRAAGRARPDRGPGQPPHPRTGSSGDDRSSADRRSTPMRGHRLPALDGLRALAIVLVVGLHAGVPGMAGGSIGVTVFFVLSGYLITSLLMRPRALSRGSIGRFYWRRFLRLFPALAAVVAVVTVYALVALEGEERRFQLLQSLASITYTNDFFMGRGADTADFGLLGQTWSLAVEEQYYLVWPLLLLATTTVLRGARARVAAVLSLAALVVLWRMHVSSDGLAAHVGMSLDTQTDGLLIGSALALLLPQARDWLVRHQAIVTLGAIASIGLLLAETAVVSSHHLLPGDSNYTLVSLASAVIITRLVLPADPQRGTGRAHAALMRLFTRRPVVWLGVISYSLYLWHRVVFEILNDQLVLDSLQARLLVAPVALGLAVGVSALSFYAIETPFLRLKDRVPGAAMSTTTPPGGGGRHPFLTSAPATAGARSTRGDHDHD